MTTGGASGQKHLITKLNVTLEAPNSFWNSLPGSGRGAHPDIIGSTPEEQLAALPRREDGAEKTVGEFTSQIAVPRVLRIPWQPLAQIVNRVGKAGYVIKSSASSGTQSFHQAAGTLLEERVAPPLEVHRNGVQVRGLVTDPETGVQRAGSHPVLMPSDLTPDGRGDHIFGLEKSLAGLVNGWDVEAPAGTAIFGNGNEQNSQEESRSITSFDSRTPVRILTPEETDAADPDPSRPGGPARRYPATGQMGQGWQNWTPINYVARNWQDDEEMQDYLQESDGWAWRVDLVPAERQVSPQQNSSLPTLRLQVRRRLMLQLSMADLERKLVPNQRHQWRDPGGFADSDFFLERWLRAPLVAPDNAHPDKFPSLSVPPAPVDATPPAELFTHPRWEVFNYITEMTKAPSMIAAAFGAVGQQGSMRQKHSEF